MNTVRMMRLTVTSNMRGRRYIYGARMKLPGISRAAKTSLVHHACQSHVAQGIREKFQFKTLRFRAFSVDNQTLSL